MDKIIFIWDFHGTLEKDNVRAVQELVNKTLKVFGVTREMTLEQAVELYGLSWVDYFKHVYPEGDIDTWVKMKKKNIELQRQGKIVEKYIKPMNFAAEVLGTIKIKGHDNILVSNTSPEWIRVFTKLVEIDDYFDEYIGLDTHNVPRQEADISEVKTKALQDYLKDKKYSRIVKIGDRESDIQAGAAVGAVTYFFRNEFNKHHKLEFQPDHEIFNLRDILKELEK